MYGTGTTTKTLIYYDKNGNVVSSTVETIQQSTLLVDKYNEYVSNFEGYNEIMLYMNLMLFIVLIIVIKLKDYFYKKFATVF